MKKIFFKLIPTSLILISLLVSCSKEVAKVYPNEITVENWEEFLDAPKEVIHNLITQEQKARKSSSTIREKEVSTGNARSTTIGIIQAWNGSSWVGISNVIVSNSFTGTTTNASGSFAFNSFGINPICMNYNTPDANGITPLDLVIINRHINGTELFEDIGSSDSDGARHYVAADVDNNGIINSVDANAIRNIVFNIPNPFGPPGSPSLPRNNMAFVPQSQLTLARVVNNPFGLSSLQNNCLQGGRMITYAIKIGDVSGDFSF